jgi:hypothetical protein
VRRAVSRRSSIGMNPAAFDPNRTPTKIARLHRLFAITKKPDLLMGCRHSSGIPALRRPAKYVVSIRARISGLAPRFWLRDCRSFSRAILE